MARGTRDSVGHPGREGRHPGPHRQVGEHEPGHAWWHVVCLVTDWWSALTQEHSSALAVIGVALVAFPKLALGLSGFETGVLVMPQVADGEGTAEERLARRIAGTRRLL